MTQPSPTPSLKVQLNSQDETQVGKKSLTLHRSAAQVTLSPVTPLVTVTASVSAPELVGVTMKVQSDPEDSYNTRRLLKCVLVEERDRG